jgi:hypothetical protein
VSIDPQLHGEPGDRLSRMAKTKTIRKKKSAGKKSVTLRPVARRKKALRSSKRSRPKRIARTTARSPQAVSLDLAMSVTRRGLGAHSAGQSGDTQGLSSVEETDSESVEELVEEGQSFEAGALSGIEDADASQGEVRTRQVLEDDVPREYLENDLDRLDPKSPVTRGAAAKQAGTSATKVNRGPVDAPGKRHRKPLPQEPLDKRMGEPRGKQMGQKSAKRDRGGRR